MSSRTSRRMGLGLILGGAVAVSSFSLSGCLLNPNNYPGQEEAVQAYNRRQVITAGLFAGAPFANTLPQAAAMNATAQVMNSNNTVRAQEFQGNNNQYSNASYNSSSENIEFFKVYTCNEFVDSNNSAEISDMRGLKDTFVKGENITSLVWFGKKYPEAQLRIFDVNGRQISEFDKLYNTQGFMLERIQNLGNLRKLSEGVYEIVIDCQGKTLAEKKVRVVSN